MNSMSDRNLLLSNNSSSPVQRHAQPVQAVCWDPTGEVLASVSEDSVRICGFGSIGGEGDCLHELISSGNKFHSCIFHPTYASLLVIGCYEVRRVLAAPFLDPFRSLTTD